MGYYGERRNLPCGNIGGIKAPQSVCGNCHLVVPGSVWTARGFRLAVHGEPTVWKSCGMPIHGTCHSFTTLIHGLTTLHRGPQVA
jgi:hypothetical protein